MPFCCHEEFKPLSRIVKVLRRVYFEVMNVSFCSQPLRCAMCCGIGDMSYRLIGIQRGAARFFDPIGNHIQSDVMSFHR